jgi:L-asparaginase
MSKKTSVYIAYTGGTIGCGPTKHGFAPIKGHLTQQLQSLKDFDHPDMPDFVIKEYANLIDSANVSPSDWHEIALDIESHYDEFDGFVILHGTDTMAYTASALSFMLEGLNKPVIVTGSQIPVGELRTDAKDNLIGAMLIAAHKQIPEVCVYFHNHLFRGNRTQKVDANGFDAFDSPNYPLLGQVGTKISIDYDKVFKPVDTVIKLSLFNTPKIGSMHLFPGISVEVLDNFLRQPIQGLILQTYGLGNGPSNNKDFLNALSNADKRGVVIINCTQCYRGSVDMSTYETGQAFIDAGVISGFDLTQEAALAKLSYLFGRGLDQQAIKAAMQQNLRGELTL